MTKDTEMFIQAVISGIPASKDYLGEPITGHSVFTANGILLAQP